MMGKCTHKDLHLDKELCDDCLACVDVMDYVGVEVCRTHLYDGYDEYDELP